MGQLEMYEDEPTQLPTGEERRHRKLFRFDPTISTGTLLLAGEILLGFGVGYGVYTADKEHNRMEVSQIKIDAAADGARVKENIKELTNKLDDIQRSLVTLGTDIAVIKARREGK